MPGLLKMVLRQMFSRPATRRYPRVKRAAAPGSRGHLINDPDVCIYCGLCARVCPADAIVVVHKPKSWTLNPYRCIVCGYCVEVCPVHSLSMDPDNRPIDS